MSSAVINWSLCSAGYSLAEEEKGAQATCVDSDLGRPSAAITLTHSDVSREDVAVAPRSNLSEESRDAVKWRSVNLIYSLHVLLQHRARGTAIVGQGACNGL